MRDTLPQKRSFAANCICRGMLLPVRVMLPNPAVPHAQFAAGRATDVGGEHAGLHYQLGNRVNRRFEADGADRAFVIADAVSIS